jgi:ribose transport system ATP-binding protein
MTPLLELRHIRKEYPGVLALEDVSFTLNPGEIHCLVGENGAGKSTLMKILAGAIGKDGGSIIIEGKEVSIRSPLDAQKLGIAMIYQEFRLVPELTVGENIALGHEPLRPGSPFVDFGKLYARAREILNQMGEEIDTAARVASLRVAKRQVVEIAKALSRNVRILAMDEPSAVLTGRELQNLFAIIRKLTAEGVGIIYISHRMEELFEIGDRVTVLRDGRGVTTTTVAQTDRASVIRWMVGRSLDREYPKIELTPGDEILALDHIGGGVVRDVSFTLRRGEILGLAGLVGAGRSELARIIFGADPRSTGTILLDGTAVSPRSPREAIDLGIGLLTEDRNKFGLMLQMSVKENVTIANLKAVSEVFFLDRRKEIAAVETYRSELQIKTPGIDRSVDQLSGGNRQKVVLARWLFTQSRVLIFDEPTAGVDVGMKYEIYNLMNDLVAKGVGVIMISSDLPEVMGMCDRIAVMCEGKLAGIIGRREATQESIMTLATGRQYLTGAA